MNFSPSKGLLRFLFNDRVGAVFAFVHDFVVCYAALYSVAAMLIVTMGILELMGITLGPIESLAMAVIVGVSIDYLVHLAFAFTNSVIADRYFKSRAAFLARSGSITAAAITTLCAVVPLMGSEMLPLRQFGIIFVIVSVVSFAFTMLFFNPLLMIAGPMHTRPHCQLVPHSLTSTAPPPSASVPRVGHSV